MSFTGKESHMTTMIISALLAFLVAVAFGKYYIPWLKRRGATQPLKDEVAQIYQERNTDENENV